MRTQGLTFVSVHEDQTSFKLSFIHLLYNSMRDIDPPILMLRKSLQESFLWFLSKIRPWNHACSSCSIPSKDPQFAVSSRVLCHMIPIYSWLAKTFIKKKGCSAWVRRQSDTIFLQSKGVCPCFCGNKMMPSPLNPTCREKACLQILLAAVKIASEFNHMA